MAERVGFEPTETTLEIKKLMENWGLLVPSEPLASPFVPVDSASRRVDEYADGLIGHLAGTGDRQLPRY